MIVLTNHKRIRQARNICNFNVVDDGTGGGGGGGTPPESDPTPTPTPTPADSATITISGEDKTFAGFSEDNAKYLHAKQYKNPDDAIQTLRNQESLIGKKTIGGVPDSNATQDDWDKFFETMGVAKDGNYENFMAEVELPEGLIEDPNQAEVFKKRLNEALPKARNAMAKAGVPAYAANNLMKELLGIEFEAHTHNQKLIAEARQKGFEELQGEFGVHYDARIQTSLAFLNEFRPKGTDVFTEDDLKADPFLAKLGFNGGKHFKTDELIGAGQTAKGKPATLGDATKAHNQFLTENGKALNDKSDPKHKEIVAENVEWLDHLHTLRQSNS